MRLSGRLSTDVSSRPTDYSSSPTIEYRDPRLKFYQTLRKHQKAEQKGKAHIDFLGLPVNHLEESEFIT